MRRKDRETTDFNTILAIIDECDIIRIGLAYGDFPYIVPLNFAYTVHGKQIDFYVHGAMAGRKYELMEKNGKCSFEMDIPLQMDYIVERKDVTMHYKCVMGTAIITFLDGEEKQEVGNDFLQRRLPPRKLFARSNGIGLDSFRKRSGTVKMLWLSITPTLLFFFSGIMLLSIPLIIFAVIFGNCPTFFIVSVYSAYK